MAKQSPFPMQPVNLHSPGAGEARSQKEPYTGKPTARPAGKPGFSSALVNLRRFLPCRLPCHRSKPEDLRLRFLRHGGIYRSDAVHNQFEPGVATPPSVGRRPCPGKDRDGRNATRSSASSAMSSGRLFLDRVARQHCPSPLHRQSHPKTVPGWGTIKWQRTANSVLTVCLSAPQRRRSLVGEGPTQVVVGRT